MSLIEFTWYADDDTTFAPEVLAREVGRQLTVNESGTTRCGVLLAAEVEEGGLAVRVTVDMPEVANQVNRRGRQPKNPLVHGPQGR